METTIDAAGRVVIPKALRDRLGLEPGRVLELREREGMIELEPAATPMRLRRTRRGVVAVPEVELPPLTDAIVRATLERTRR
jgi:AbrB family looped-hinge helix DNA binding protein